MRIDEVLAPLVGSGGRDGPGQLDDLGQAARRVRVGNPDPERSAVSGAAGTGDVPGRVDQYAGNSVAAERGECVLRRPALDESGGSNPPGTAHGSNQASDRSRAVAQRPRTSATSAGSSALVISPRRSRLTGLSGRQVLKVASARCKMATASASCPLSSPPVPSAATPAPPGPAAA